MRILSTLLILTILCPTFAWAEDTAALSQEVQNELTTQANAARRQLEAIPLKPDEKPEIELEEKKETKIIEGETGPTFFVKKINIQGNTIIPSSVLKETVSAFENRKATFSHLRSFSEIVTNAYRAQGYLTSRAYLPPQTIEDGQVTVKVLEGKVGKIFVEGNKYFSKESYEKYMKFGSLRVFRYQDLERDLYMLNRRPDRKAKAFLIAGEALGSSDIILKVKDSNPFHAYYSFSNRGTKLTHRSRHSLNLNHNNFLGLDDTLNMSYTLAEQGTFGGGSFYYDLPVADTPINITLSGGYVKTILAKHLSIAEIKGESTSFSPSISYAIVQRPDQTISVNLGLDFVNSISRINDIQTSADRVRTLHLGPRIAIQDMGGRSILSGDVHVGLPGFLSGLERDDESSTVENTGGDFLYYTGSVTRIQRLPETMFLVMKMNGQWTRDTLVSVEQFRAGGSSSVRGYPESDAGGDYGWGAGAELNIPIFGLPKTWTVPYTKKTWKESLRLVGFAEMAKTYFRERSFSTSVKDKTLIGAGFGTRFNIDDNVSIEADFGWPLGDDSVDENQGQTHLSMRAGF